MEVTITARHFELTEPLKTRLEKKVLKLEKISNQIIGAHIILEETENRATAEVVLHSKSYDLRAQSKSYDMYTACENVVKKIRHQVRTHEEKIKHHRYKGS